MNKVFQKYKDIHKGERAFLIANGPSLNQTNLDLIENEISFAMNRISLKYDETLWRPTYYFFSSTNVTKSKPWHQQWRESVRKAASEEKTTCFIADMFRKDIDPKADYPNIEWFGSLSENKPDVNGNIHPACFSTNVVERIDKTGTTMNLALQLCYHMGISEIILLGADLGWKKDAGTSSDPNHFSKSYIAEIRNPDKANHQMRNIHSLASAYYKKFKPDVKIYNASKKTVLDVYPIIDFEKLIKEEKVAFLDEKREISKAFWQRPPQYGFFDQ